MAVVGIVEVMSIMANPDSSKSKCSLYDKVDQPMPGKPIVELLQPPQINIVFKPGRKAMAG
jgi:hypothetical protein